MKKYISPNSKVFEIVSENIAQNKIIIQSIERISVSSEEIEYNKENEESAGTEFAAPTYRTTLWGND